MKYWKEATESEFNVAISRCLDKNTSKKYVLIKEGNISEVLKEITHVLGGRK